MTFSQTVVTFHPGWQGQGSQRRRLWLARKLVLDGPRITTTVTDQSVCPAIIDVLVQAEAIEAPAPVLTDSARARAGEASITLDSPKYVLAVRWAQFRADGSRASYEVSADELSVVAAWMRTSLRAMDSCWRPALTR